MGAVASFESGPQGLLPLGRHESLAAASAALPHGAYTTFRSYGGCGVVRLAQHLRRLEESAALEGTPGRIDARGGPLRHRPGARARRGTPSRGCG